jgi:hypothetical protein
MRDRFSRIIRGGGGNNDEAVLLIYENCCAEPPCKKGGAGHGLLMMPALLRLFMQVYISWAWAFSLPPFGVMRKNALQQWSRAVAA